jgi:arylsulfatase A-like enzyme
MKKPEIEWIARVVMVVATAIVVGRAEGNAPLPCSATFDCDEATVSPIDPGHHNILLVVSDDHAYCHYGFVRTLGACPDGTPCDADADCAPDRCRFELTCRNRGIIPAKDGGSFPFDRAQYDSTDLHVTTPYLDDLARNGAVFPRAHVVANICWTSRQTLLLGRHARHVNYLMNGGDGTMECRDSRQGCTSNADCPGSACVPVRTIPTLLKTLSSAGYRTFASGKLQFINNEHGFDAENVRSATPGVGKFKCTDQCTSEDRCDASCPECGACQQDLVAGDIPPEAHERVREIRDFIESDTHGIIEATETTSKQRHPFFVWYGPHIPHKPTTPEPFFDGYYTAATYAPLKPAQRKHLARISWLDMGIGAILEYLKSACVCVRDPETPTKRSLFERTVVVFLADQGFLLPKAKGNDRENTHRTVMIVSEPRHRDGAAPVPPHVFAEDFANATDVLQTVMAYAGIPSAERFAYPFARDLRPFMENPTASGPVRDLQYGDKGQSSVPTKGSNHYAINRPGTVGVCATTPTANGHRKPCIHAKDCKADGTEACVMPSGSGLARRCVNRPGVACDDDGDCAVGLCNGTTCVAGAGAYKDREGAGCVGNPAACVPAGACQPVMLKVEVDAKGRAKRAYDLNADPDQQTQLLKVDPVYLGPCITYEFERCLNQFANYDPNARTTTAPAHPGGCPETHFTCRLP